MTEDNVIGLLYWIFCCLFFIGYSLSLLFGDNTWIEYFLDALLFFCLVYMFFEFKISKTLKNLKK